MKNVFTQQMPFNYLCPHSLPDMAPVVTQPSSVNISTPSTQPELQARNIFLVAYIWGFGGHLHPRSETGTLGSQVSHRGAFIDNVFLFSADTGPGLMCWCGKLCSRAGIEWRFLLREQYSSTSLI